MVDWISESMVHEGEERWKGMRWRQGACPSSPTTKRKKGKKKQSHRAGQSQSQPARQKERHWEKLEVAVDRHREKMNMKTELTSHPDLSFTRTSCTHVNCRELRDSSVAKKSSNERASQETGKLIAWRIRRSPSTIKSLSGASNKERDSVSVIRSKTSNERVEKMERESSLSGGFGYVD